MKNNYIIIAAALLLMSCNPSVPIPEGKTVTFTETEEQMANPERGFYVQKYYTPADLEDTVALQTVIANRERSHITLYLHSYYLADTVTGCPSYIESDIDPVFLERLDRNMNTLREGGAKAILRFSYKYTRSIYEKPWDATPEWAMKHMDQLAPYLQKHADVIYCVQAGFIGVWGEWYYTTNYPQNPAQDEGYATRWPVAEHLMEVVPADRQICFRQPQFKMRYLRTHGMEEKPLTAGEAYQPTIKARWAGHNDCFVSGEGDVGTYHNDEERAFWAEDTKYTLMGGETCKQCDYSNGANAVKEMEKYHWSYLCNSYHPDVLREWVNDNHYNEIKRRLGYRIALDKAVVTENAEAGNMFEAFFVLHNSGFAAPMNKRDIELVFVKVNNPNEKYVYPQSEDPRFWFADEVHHFTLKCQLDAKMKGDYKLYLNLPDPYPSLHDNPAFSIRLANDNVWEEETGYNLITTVTVQ
ncbi:MAG: DUF4832 domain-containing protein [Paludibacteraceae bacterium]|nr:DUF4832 domain-containing protein [Paludibacteraceae bacterium]